MKSLPNISSKMSDIEEEKSGPKPVAPSAAVLERGMTEAVVGGPLLGVLQRVVGLVDFLELALGFVVAGIAVGMELHRELAVGPFDRRLVGSLGDPEHFVEIAFSQSGRPLAALLEARRH